MVKRNIFNTMKIKSSEITPENIYKNRRKFLKDVGVIAGTALLSQNIAPFQIK